MLNDPSTRLAMRTLSEREASRENNDLADDSQPSQPIEAAENQPADLRQEPSTGAEQESNPESVPSLNTEPSTSSSATSGQNAIGRTINEIQDSITTMREEYIDRHNAEPDVSLRYSAQGVESSSISIDRTPQQIQLQQSLAAANLVN